MLLSIVCDLLFTTNSGIISHTFPNSQIAGMTTLAVLLW